MTDEEIKAAWCYRKHAGFDGCTCPHDYDPSCCCECHFSCTCVPGLPVSADCPHEIDPDHKGRIN